MLTIKKVGGIYHWRIGRLGGSFYFAKRKPSPSYSAHRNYALVMARINASKGA